MKVRVVEPFTWSHVGGFFRAYLRPGVVEINDEDARLLLERGLVVEPDAEQNPRRAARVSSPAERQREPEGSAEPEPAGDAPQRPRKAAALDAWRAYATAKGVDPKGMTKAELIAAVG